MNDLSREAILLGEALALPSSQRGTYLDQACRADAELRRTVQALLDAHEDAGAFLGTATTGGRLIASAANPLLAAAENAVPMQKPGERIGRYKLLEQIGEGGCGVVFMAEQEEPVRRRVALKIIKLGMDTKEVIARFEAERQALAMMDHPNIAKVLDAGATERDLNERASVLDCGSPLPLSHRPPKAPEDWRSPRPDGRSERLSAGRPYFVMELVRGIKITEYCDQNNLTTKERLDLFMQVCRAIQHAHQKGIIHRDVKPSNILVTLHDGVPVPKVIDFGIAKATQGRLTDQTLFTAFQQFIGTPAYMSPEQAEMSGLDIDTRSDIYSLGVLLYELLTGKTPFDGKELLAAGVDAMRRTIREKEPQPPSTRLNTMLAGELTATAKHRQVEATKLPALVRGDLDWIVMKCLDKDRTRRYETANGLATDIQRHLSNEAVLACPPSAAYRFQKAWRRNKLVMSGGAAFAALLIIATGISTWQAIRASRAEALAARRLSESEQAREEAEAISKFLSEVFRSPNPNKGQRTITVAESLDAAVEKLEKDSSIAPTRRCSLQAAIGATYYSLGLYREAIALQEKVLAYERGKHGLDHPHTLTAMSSLANSYSGARRKEEALKLKEQLLALRRKMHGPEHSDTLATMGNLASSYSDVGRKEEALKLRIEVLTLFRKVKGPEHPNMLAAMGNLALSLHDAGRHEEALKLEEEVLPLWRKVQGPEHPSTLMAMNNLASSYSDVGRKEEALKLRDEVLPLFRKVLGTEHPTTLVGMQSLANSYADAGRKEEALELREEELLLRSKVQGPEHPYTLDAMHNLANSYADAGRKEEALKLREEVLPLYRKVRGPEHSTVRAALSALANSYQDAERFVEAEALYRELVEYRRKYKTKGQTSLAGSLVGLGECLLRQGKYALAEPHLRDGLTVLEEKEPEKSDTFTAQSLLGECLSGQRQYEKAEPILLKAYESLKKRDEQKPSASHAKPIREAGERIVKLYEAWGKPEQAADWRKKLEAAATEPNESR